MHMAGGILIVGGGSFKGRKVVLAYEGMGCFFEGVQIQRLWNVPHAEAIENGTYRVIQDSVLVGFLFCAIPCVEGLRHLLSLVNADIFGENTI